MRKGALKKKRRQLEELHLDRREALGELILGMYVQGNWDENIMSRGAAEVREVADELDALGAPPSAPVESPEQELPLTGEHTAEHSLPETGEHTGSHAIPEPGMPETAEHTREHSIAAESAVAKAEPEKPKNEKRGDDSPAATVESGPPGPTTPKAGTPDPEAPRPDAAEKSPAGTSPAPTSKPAAPPKPAPSPTAEKDEKKADSQKVQSELDLLEEKIGKSESQAKTAAEAAKAANAADSRTELSAITREIESDRARLTSTLTTAALRIADAEKRADAAEAKLARESAANREAAAGWVRGQAAEIEADAALAAEIASAPDGGAVAGAPAPAPRQAELEARIKTLEASLEAEKASKIEALTIAESRLKAIEESAREAEKRVEEAEASLAEAGTAPVSVAAAPGMVTEAEAREAAVDWLRGQIAALRQEISKGQGADVKGGS